MNGKDLFGKVSIMARIVIDKDYIKPLILF